MKTEDGEIISKCLNGDSTAFGLLVDKYKESIYALAYSRLRNFHDAEDVTQEVFISAFRRLKTLRRWDSFLGWLYSITSNLCKMQKRSQSRRPDREFLEDQESQDIDWINSHREKELHESLHEALDSLPDIYQQVLTLYYLGGMNIAEIARFLGISPGTIKERLSRARVQLKKEMLTMMGQVFEQQRLKAGFTFRIVEIVKRIRLNPISPKTLPWGISLATGVIIAVLSIGTHLSPINTTGAMSGSPLPSESKVQKVGEFPVDVLKLSNISVISNQRWNGNGLGSVVPSLQNALFLSPQAEGGTWTKKADMPIERDEFASCAVNGKIYVIGGIPNSGVPIQTVEEYDPVLDKWTKKTDMPTVRYGVSANEVNGKIYIVGGVVGNNPVPVPTVEEYDLLTDTWSKKADIPTARMAFSTSAINGKIYAFGGWKMGAGIEFSIVEEYDPVADTWTKKADMPTGRQMLTTSSVNGRIYAIGGWRNGNILTTLEEYDPVTDTWQKRADMLTARCTLSSSAVMGKIYAIGGWRGKNDCLSTVEEYDPATDTWQKKADMPTARYSFSSSVVNDKIYAMGGYDFKKCLSIVEEYNTETAGQSINFKGKLPTTWGDVRTVMKR